ncbi:MAG: bifunctional demethylmenaquinone methyltransferase/2-methoxy-6-polyprenyl-1,4-benzoquinol methylase UbiE [Muribaculaceae bacterium]|nr:bifunctional demethylmenaquinone methyltransferase/2-methoxy-6-polyprenyl-1,4-benzoquinol methylase UbiE [Muribaculaceae bacterium]
MEVEKITPYGDSRDKGRQVEEMFDSIAPAYDFMNRAMTLGIDKLWRRTAVGFLSSLRPEPRSIVDVATGTGDLAIALARALPEARITGVDLSEGMLAVGRRKAAEAGLEGRIDFARGDGLALPVAEGTADAVAIAYGIRNFADIPGGYRQMFKVLRPGGALVVLELSTPTAAIPKALYKLYTRTLIPLVGRLVSKDTRAYSYLPESIAAVAQGASMTELMADAGFERCSFRPMTFGACTLYTAFRPAD